MGSGSDGSSSGATDDGAGDGDGRWGYYMFGIAVGGGLFLLFFLLPVRDRGGWGALLPLLPARLMLMRGGA